MCKNGEKSAKLCASKQVSNVNEKENKKNKETNESIESRKEKVLSETQKISFIDSAASIYEEKSNENARHSESNGKKLKIIFIFMCAQRILSSETARAAVAKAQS